jgi:hypothetical protein
MNKLIVIGTLVLGFGGGAWWGYHVGSADSAVPVAHAGIPSLVMREPGLSAGRAADADSSQMRALIREEMTAVLAARSGGSAATPTPVHTPVSPEQQAERRQALEEIDALVTQGAWGNEQRASFRQKLVTLDPEQREQALSQIAMAINNGSLQVSTDGPPL